ncbi:hypothetical protein chiPu_0017333 [Chiloscyllium punctatum]|uniref:Uncharacterized protein n=1 Tax=Chiloscyllium punctatum TaxID=137246 RepID=A0A401RF34_CHIPU|nr:hypothetical protein [Chiloscyllium punctatum]
MTGASSHRGNVNLCVLVTSQFRAGTLRHLRGGLVSTSGPINSDGAELLYVAATNQERRRRGSGDGACAVWLGAKAELESWLVLGLSFLAAGASSRSVLKVGMKSF